MESEPHSHLACLELVEEFATCLALPDNPTHLPWIGTTDAVLTSEARKAAAAARAKEELPGVPCTEESTRCTPRGNSSSETSAEEQSSTSLSQGDSIGDGIKDSSEGRSAMSSKLQAVDASER